MTTISSSKPEANKKQTGTFSLREKLPGALTGAALCLCIYFWFITGSNLNGENLKLSWLIYVILTHKKLFLLSVFGGGILGALLYPFRENIGNTLYRFRYLIALAVFLLCLLFQLSGSSIGYWRGLMADADEGVLMGISRAPRSDEWGSLTPLCLSQENNELGAYSRYYPSQNGVEVDTAIVYASPSWDLLTLFRPFYWGYLLFGSGIGLAWFWCGRTIALLLSLFELGMLLTDKNRKLSVLLAIGASFAPVLQWWFAVNGLAEQLIYGSCLMLGANCLLTTKYSWKKYAVGFGMALVACGYVLTFYPSWMAIVAWCFVPVFFWILIKKSRWELLKKRDILPWLWTVLLCALGMCYLIVSSWDTLQSVFNSSYPGGANHFTGGGGFLWLFRYPICLFSWLYNDTRIVENSAVFGFAPLELILALWVIFREKKRDFLLIACLIVDVMLMLYISVGFPSWLATGLLLFYSSSPRTAQIIGYLQLFILIRALSLKEKRIKPAAAAVIAAVLAVLMVFLARIYSQNTLEALRFDYLDNLAGKALPTALVLGIAFYFLLCTHKKNYRAAAAFCSAVVLFSTLWVNPLRSGTGVITESPTIEQIRALAEEDPDAVWTTLNTDYPGTNMPLLAGVNSVTSTQTYPLNDRWSVLDPDGTWYDLYNRYCHVCMQLGEETKIELIAQDNIRVTVTEDDLQLLNIRYIVCPNDSLTETRDEWDMTFREVYRGANFSIFECIYAE